MLIIIKPNEGIGFKAKADYSSQYFDLNTVLLKRNNEQ